MRPDLLALTPDDLATLGNRGLVKRAQTELEKGELTFTLEEDAAGNVTVRWSDPAECLLPAGKVVSDGRCSCSATSLCRHLIRSVLAYQKSAATMLPASSPASETTPQQEREPASVSAPLEPWDPGTISDAEIARLYTKAALTRAQRQSDEGHVVELTRGIKPSAHFHTLSCTVRFPVPGRLDYAACDCAEPKPCAHALLSVWAFRQLPADQVSGLVSTRRHALPVPTPLLDELETLLLDFAEAGLSSASRAMVDRFRRLEARCRAEGLVWPGEILAELVEQFDAYREHDARFAPVRVADLAGELLIRADAIRADTDAVPQLFVRGTAADRVTELGNTRLFGLGCGVRTYRGGVEVTAFLQDDDAGIVVAMGREFNDPIPPPPSPSGLPAAPPEPPRDYWQLARTPILKTTSLASLGAGQVVVQGGKRTPSYRFLPGRARAEFREQQFRWETLRAPVLVEDFAELAARVEAQPPSCLAPRRVGQSFHVCPVTGVTALEFSPLDQVARALVTDAAGNQAVLAHPYSSRGREGTEEMLARLTAQGNFLRFVAGQVRPAGGMLVLSPTALVFEEDGRRSLVQPWVDRFTGTPGAAPNPEERNAALSRDPITAYPAQLSEALGELLLLGLQRAGEDAGRHWEELHRHGQALGFNRFIRPLGRVVEALGAKRRSVHWDARPAAAALLETLVLARLAREEPAVTGL